MLTQIEDVLWVEKQEDEDAAPPPPLWWKVSLDGLAKDLDTLNAFVAALWQCTTLTSLDLSHNVEVRALSSCLALRCRRCPSRAITGARCAPIYVYTMLGGCNHQGSLCSCARIADLPCPWPDLAHLLHLPPQLPVYVQGLADADPAGMNMLKVTAVLSSSRSLTACHGYSWHTRGSRVPACPGCCCQGRNP